MKARDHYRKAPSSDLLVCFPSRAHLTLMPKPICSPSTAIEPNKGHRSHHRRNKSTTAISGRVSTSSPLLWAQNKQITGGGGSEVLEPTSPEVTCAGQIKVRRHKGAAACKSWQSVMEEIERIHSRRKIKKRSSSSWVGSIGIKKEVMQFLTCLRNLKFDFQCFGMIPPSEITSDDDHEEEELEEEKELGDTETDHRGGDEKENCAPPPPPANALLLMRCRSAPAKSWQEEKEEKELEDEKRRTKEEKKGGKNLKTLMEEEKRDSKKVEEESTVMMEYDKDYYRISLDIAKETWVHVDVGGPVNNQFSTS